jgi:hypothetical protein
LIRVSFFLVSDGFCVRQRVIDKKDKKDGKIGPKPFSPGARGPGPPFSDIFEKILPPDFYIFFIFFIYEPISH